jgi:hypothetical protein
MASLFNFAPQNYYSRTPGFNQNPATFYNPGELQPTGYGKQPDIAGYLGYGAAVGAITVGTQGYRLPTQNFYNYGVNNPGLFGTQTLKTSLKDVAINAALTGLVYGLTGGPSTDPTNGRLSGTGVQQGATPAQLLPAQNPRVNPDDGKEDRVIIYDQTGRFIGQSDIFKPLKNTGGVLFPYTPTIQVNHKASYEMLQLVHTNYPTPAYQHSAIETINIQGLFTANYRAEAEYIIAMMHFFRTATKMFYGQDQLAGTPPPVLFLDGYGPYTFDHIPVVVTSFDYTLPNDVDYISCNIMGSRQKVPTTLTVSLNLTPTYSRNKVSNEFGLENYSKGSLKTSGQGNRSGGWI